ncbi:Crp/Fnr family transcriptional regulator [Roseovarius phycicola]|uniref:Cyclic nucleotide-binding domain-containing protein n=1 Tax=Roseovarius phycicola TaxID=3080976 RepID=A0ABZ2HD47_9RHOB
MVAALGPATLSQLQSLFDSRYILCARTNAMSRIDMDVAFLTDSEQKIVRQSALFSSMSADTFQHVLASGAVSDVKKGEYLFDQGRPADMIYLVLKGWAQIKRVEQDGSCTLISTFGVGQTIGEAPAFLRKPYPASAQAMTDVRVFAINGQTIVEIMQEDPEVLSAALAAVYVKLHELVNEVESLKSRTLRERLALFLLEHLPNEVAPASMRLPFGKALIAAKIGTSPEQLSRTFRELNPHGVHISGRTATIDNPDALRQLLHRV